MKKLLDEILNTARDTKREFPVNRFRAAHRENSGTKEAATLETLICIQ